MVIQDRERTLATLGVTRPHRAVLVGAGHPDLLVFLTVGFEKFK
jgi:hypothetical protein